MIGFNHALVGGLISKLLPLPLAIPAAFASHFVLDALPHYGIPAKKRNTSTFWKVFFAIDFMATFSLAVWTILNHHYAMFVCGLSAVLPDFVWVVHVARKRSFDFTGVKSRYEKWHIRIQHYEFPGGIWIELPLVALLSYALFVRSN